MADVLTPEQRSFNMSRIRGKDTSPEMFVRRLVHRLGYRYRLHSPKLPGKPDLVFTSRRKVIFVNGCYWHVHDCPRGQVAPKSNTIFWAAKRQSNVDRDSRNAAKLANDGWRMLVVWECDIRHPKEVERAIVRFLRCNL